MSKEKAIGYSRQELDGALALILGFKQVKAMLQNHVGRPKICEMAASSIVRDQLDWNRQDVRIISSALRDLHVEGQFNFNDDKAYPNH